MISKGNYSRLAHSLVQYFPKQSCADNLRPEDYSSPVTLSNADAFYKPN